MWIHNILVPMTNNMHVYNFFLVNFRKEKKKVIPIFNTNLQGKEGNRVDIANNIKGKTGSVRLIVIL